MDFSARDILDEEHRKATIHIASISTDHFPITYSEQALSAMKRYAEQEAKTYANWIFRQEIGRRTPDKLWKDYQK